MEMEDTVVGGGEGEDRRHGAYQQQVLPTSFVKSALFAKSALKINIF
jgi:hypothetical protein